MAAMKFLIRLIVGIGMIIAIADALWVLINVSRH